MVIYHVVSVTADTEDHCLVRQCLMEAPPSVIRDLAFQVNWVPHIAQAIALLSVQTIDIILLFIKLPYSQGISALEHCQHQIPHLPVVVLTESKDEALRVQSLQLGAQGYLVKDQIDSRLLVYSIRLAIEQKQQLAALQYNQLKQLQEEEILGLASLADTAKTQITAKLFGLASLREGSPDIFQEVVQQYGALMDLSLEQRTYKVEHNISEQLRTMGEQLGFLKASPRDVIEIHTQVLKDKTHQSTPQKSQAYVVEGRLMVLELMGYLASYYRKYFIGLSKLNVSKTYQNQNP